MLAIVMAGGKGSRMHFYEKPMLMINGKPMISYVLNSLKDSYCFTNILCAVSKNTRNTMLYLSREGIDTIETSGEGYSQDLNYLLMRVREKAFIVSADLPLLDPEIIRYIISIEQRKPCISIMVSKYIIDALGISNDLCIEHNGRELCYSGINIIESNANNILDEELFVIDDPRIAFNVNTERELRLVEKLVKARLGYKK